VESLGGVRGEGGSAWGKGGREEGRVKHQEEGGIP